MRRWIVLFALCTPNFTGCLYYAYPTLTHTPEVAVPRPNGSEHAFRIDIDKTEHKPLPASTQYTLSKIPLDPRGLVPSQLEVAGATGVYNLMGSGQHEKSNYTIIVRLYKPGFQTVEVKAWEKSREVNWLPAPDLAAQEKAIDDLLADPEAPNVASVVPIAGNGIHAARSQLITWWDQKDQKSPPLGLQPGGAAGLHRAAMQFAAGEYERLATTNPNAGAANMQTTRERLQAKARWLREYAEKGPMP